jgi:hypothetical protein
MQFLFITKSKFPPGESLWQRKKSSIHQLLNFTTMKKSIFLILVIALFIGAAKQVQGQSCPAARAVDITCLPNSAINPIPGTMYNYTIDVPAPPGTKEFYWIVTTDQTFIENGVLTNAIEYIAGPYLSFTGNGYADPVTGTATVQLTWEYFDPNIPVFVIIQVKNTDATCTSQNMKVYRIEPLNAFTLDISNVDQNGVALAGYGSDYSFCVHDIVTATYDANAPEGVIYDFGVDSLYYVVNAANYSTSWMPSVMVSNFAGMGEITYVGWARPTWPGFAWTPMLFDGTVYSPAAPVPVLDPSGTVGPNGECIVIVVVIDHSTTTSYQGIADTQISMAVDGMTQVASPDPQGDVHFSSTLPSPNLLCGLEDDFEFDVALQTLKARPEIIDLTPPAGDDFLPIKP